MCFLSSQKQCLYGSLNKHQKERGWDMFYSDVQQRPQVWGQEWSPLNAENFTTKNKCDAEIRESP